MKIDEIARLMVPVLSSFYWQDVKVGGEYLMYSTLAEVTNTRGENVMTWGIALTVARDLVRAEGVEFISHPDVCKALIRASSKQALNRGRRFGKAACRKAHRAVAIVTAVTPTSHEEQRAKDSFISRSTRNVVFREIREARRKNAPPGLD